MASVSYKVCDRCGEKINEHSMKRAIIHTEKRYKVLAIIGGLVHESKMELCGDCSDSLDNFLYPKKEI